MGYFAAGIHMCCLYTSPDTVLQVWCQNPSEIQVYAHGMRLFKIAAKIAAKIATVSSIGYCKT